MRKARARVPSAKGRDMPKHNLKMPRPLVPIHIGEIIPVWIFFEQPLYFNKSNPTTSGFYTYLVFPEDNIHGVETCGSLKKF
jgi:hypothetical protein